MMLIGNERKWKRMGERMVCDEAHEEAYKSV